MWLIFTLTVMLCWGAADLFYKKGSDEQDSMSHLKIVVAVGFVMGVHGLLYMLVKGVSFSISDTIKYMPVSACYIISMALGYFGLRYIELSVASPVQNSSGAVVSLLCVIFLRHIPDTFEIIGVLLVTAGLVWMGIEEKKESDLELKNAGITPEKKYTVGIGAFMFPILYCLIDGLGTFADAIYLNENAPILSEDSALLAYEFTFFVCGILALLYITLIKKERYVIREQRNRFLAAIFETAGQFAYVFIIGGNAFVAAPMVASYCVVSVILSAIFLKEKLSLKQYAIIAVVVLGIATLTISEGI